MKDSVHECMECEADGAPATESRLVYDYDLPSENNCDAESDGRYGGGTDAEYWNYAAFAPDGLLWRSWDSGLYAINLKQGVVKREICSKSLKAIKHFAISASGTLWAYAPMEHGVINFMPSGQIIQHFTGVKARDIAIDHDGNVWAVSAGSVVEIIDAARKPQYFPYNFNLPNAPQWP